MKWIFFLILVFILGFSIFTSMVLKKEPRKIIKDDLATVIEPTIVVEKKYFVEDFGKDSIIEEASSMGLSKSRDWWLSSGGKFVVKEGLGKTNIGDMEPTSKWNKLYLQNNPIDTDGGVHPQNIFRFVNKHKYLDYEQQVYFWVEKDNFSDSPQRNESNGVLLFNRYRDENNLYYLGVRVDGKVIVKKKQGGAYLTLGSKQIFEGIYNRAENINLMPHKTWIGIKSEVMNTKDGGVSLKVFTDVGKTGVWKLQLTIEDLINPILSEGYAGIRSDFMDVFFDDYKVGY